MGEERQAAGMGVKGWGSDRKGKHRCRGAGSKGPHGSRHMGANTGGQGAGDKGLGFGPSPHASAFPTTVVGRGGGGFKITFH